MAADSMPITRMVLFEAPEAKLRRIRPSTASSVDARVSPSRETEQSGWPLASMRKEPILVPIVAASQWRGEDQLVIFASSQRVTQRLVPENLTSFSFHTSTVIMETGGKPFLSTRSRSSNCRQCSGNNRNRCYWFLFIPWSSYNLSDLILISFGLDMVPRISYW